MKRFTAFAIGLVIALSVSHAATPLPPAPSTGWCYDSLVTPNYNGVKACVVTEPPVGTVPPGRLTRTSVKYPNVPPSNAVRPNVDVTQWANFFGHSSALDAASPWPGARGAAPAFTPFTAAGYVALEFTPAVKAQVSVGVSTYYGWLVDWTYSTQPGYFNPVPSLCSGTAGAGQAFTKASSDPAKAGCPTPIGQRMFLNIKMHASQASAPTVAFNVGY